MSDKTSQVEKKLLDIKLVEIFPSSLLSTRKNQLIDGEAKELPLPLHYHNAGFNSSRYY
jgi:hypothetical protein